MVDPMPWVLVAYHHWHGRPPLGRVRHWGSLVGRPDDVKDQVGLRDERVDRDSISQYGSLAVRRRQSLAKGVARLRAVVARLALLLLLGLLLRDHLGGEPVGVEVASQAVLDPELLEHRLEALLRVDGQQRPLVLRELQDSVRGAREDEHGVHRLERVVQNGLVSTL